MVLVPGDPCGQRLARAFGAVVFVIAVVVADGAGAWQEETDRPGGDIVSLELSRPDPADCARLCAEQEGCRAWTLVRPGLQGRLARCWLKASVPQAVANTCCTSGLVDERAGTLPAASAGAPCAGDGDCPGSICLLGVCAKE